MPLIEELPVTNATTRPSHGWTYVTDNASGTQPPAAPLKSRKRGRDGGATATAQATHRLTAKQEKAIQQRLNDLGKENHRDVHIPIPKREGGKPGKERKTTQNVRRILGYSRTFQHYLADEEAGTNPYGSAGVVAANPATAATAAHGGQPSGGRADSKRKGTANESSSSTATQKKPVAAALPPPPKRSGSLKQAASSQRPATPVKKENSEAGGDDVKMSDAPSATSPTRAAGHPASKSPTTPASASASAQKSPQPKPLSQQQHPPPSPAAAAASNTTGTDNTAAPNPQAYDPACDHDPLLKTLSLPKQPSDRLMAALLAEPPLSYTAARAKPLDDAPSVEGGSNLLLAKPARHFCAICGYWGKVRCKRGCGERVCGLLECWRAHDGVCALGAY